MVNRKLAPVSDEMLTEVQTRAVMLGLDDMSPSNLYRSGYWYFFFMGDQTIRALLAYVGSQELLVTHVEMRGGWDIDFGAPVQTYSSARISTNSPMVISRAQIKGAILVEDPPQQVTYGPWKTEE